MFKKGFNIFTIVLIFMISSIMIACSNSNIYTYIIDESYDDFITLGTSADYAPYEWPMLVDGKQTLVGIDIEIAKLIAAELGKNLKVVNKGFDFLLDDLVNGKVDFVLAGMTPTDERAEKVDFSIVYYEAIQVVLINESMVSTYTSIESLNLQNLKIGAQLGTIQQDLVNESFPLSQKQFIQNVPDLVIRLMDGQINAVVLEEPVATGYVLNHNGLAIANFSIGDPDGGSAVAVQKGNIELLNSINKVLNEIISTGQINQIVQNAVLLNGTKTNE
jgi:polar amino acid transport system substrate-binding protein